MATEGTKLQVNFKLADGTLINVYAANQAELEAQLTTIGDVATLIASTSKALGTQSAVSHIAQSLGGAVISPSAPVSPLSLSVDTCKHGDRTLRESKPGAPKAWKGYFCPTAKGTPDQCEPNFLK
jgi:hypothetical protein